MKKANLFLEKFKKIVPPDDALRKSVATVVSKVLGRVITKAQVRIFRGSAFVDVTSVQKNKLRMSRREILDEIAESVGERLSDIR